MRTSLLMIGLLAAIILAACTPANTVVDTGSNADDDNVVVDDRRDAQADRDQQTTVNVYDDEDPVYVDDNPDTVVVERTQPQRTVVITTWESGEQEKNEDIARDFIESTATYEMDGSDLTLADSTKLGTNPPLLVYDFTYTSENSGYGDRSTRDGEETQHRTRVVIMNGDIISAITDGLWNELTHRPVSAGSDDRLQGDMCGGADDAGCVSDLYCFRTSDASDASGYCVAE
jgi:hypothetical protein